MELELQFSKFNTEETDEWNETNESKIDDGIPLSVHATNIDMKNLSWIPLAVFSMLKTVQIYYIDGKTAIFQLVENNMAYSLLYVIILLVLMIYPLMGLFWIFIWNAAIALIIVFIVHTIHKYIGHHVVACAYSVWSRS